MDFLEKVDGENYNMLQITMTLATLAYSEPPKLKLALENKSLATENNWSLVWGPVNKKSNSVYVVKKKTSNDYVISIRGTVPNFESIFIDADSMGLASLPWNKQSGKMISDGISDAWKHVNDMIDPDTGKSLNEFTNDLAQESTIYVTGHSQGACLASVVSLWLAQTHDHLNFRPITFAAETAGNKSFSDLFNNTFKDNLRVFNPNDIVPMGFGDLDKIKHLYGTEPPYVSCPVGFKLVVDVIKAFIPKYVQAGKAYPLNNSFVVKVNGHVDDGNRLNVFLKEMEIQHSYYTYLHLLNAPLTNGGAKTWPPDFIKA